MPKKKLTNSQKAKRSRRRSEPGHVALLANTCPLTGTVKGLERETSGATPRLSERSDSSVPNPLPVRYHYDLTQLNLFVEGGGKLW